MALQGRTGLLMAVSWALAIAQVIAVMGIANTTIYGKCATNEQCVSGKYCYPNFGTDDAKGGNCQFCGSAPPLPIQYDGNGGVLNVAVHPDFVGHNETAVIELCHPPIVPTMGTSGLLTPWPFGARAVENWCDECHHAETQRTSEMTMYTNNKDNYSAMTFVDFMAVWLCAAYVGLKIAEELDEMEACQIVMRRAESDVKGHWRCLYAAQTFVRRYFFLPPLVGTIPLVILGLGSASGFSPLLVMTRECLIAVCAASCLNICFNTIALVFLLEVDNVLYSVAVPAAAQARLAAAAARIGLSQAEGDELSRTKIAHFVSVGLFIRFGMGVLGNGDSFAAMMLNYIVQGAVQTVVSLAADSKQTSKPVVWPAAGFLPGEIVSIINRSEGGPKTAFLIAVEAIKVVTQPFVWLGKGEPSESWQHLADLFSRNCAQGWA